MVHETLESRITRLLDNESFHEWEFLALTLLEQNTLIETIYRIVHNTTIGLSEGNIAEIRRFIAEANGGTKKEL